MSLESLHTLSALLLIGAEGAADASPVREIVAQIVTTILCFFLVFWILKRFAFGPLLAVIDERRDRIESDLNKAEELKNQAIASQASLEERLRNIERESREKMVEVVNEGKRVSASIQEDARREAAAMLEKAKRDIHYETEKARLVLKEEVINLTINATEQLIHERLDDQKHRELIGNFMTQIER